MVGAATPSQQPLSGRLVKQQLTPPNKFGVGFRLNLGVSSLRFPAARCQAPKTCGRPNQPPAQQTQFALGRSRAQWGLACNAPTIPGLFGRGGEQDKERARARGNQTLGRVEPQSFHPPSLRPKAPQTACHSSCDAEAL